MFKKYMHIERYGNDGVQGIEFGKCYIFPKLDGTNSSIWSENNCILKTGSRNRELSFNNDNAGFYKHTIKNKKMHKFLENHSNLRLYIEWLVPHSLKTYEKDAWNHSYVIDVFNDNTDKYLSYDIYKPILEKYGINYIPAMSILKNSDYSNLLVELQNNKFLIKEGEGIGEGIVIKNYDFINKFGNMIYAKIVTNYFKEKHIRIMGPSVKKFKEILEQKVIDECITNHLVNKVYAKIVNKNNGWNSKYVPDLFNNIYYDLINEEIWNFIKLKKPTINFKTLYIIMVTKIKEIKPEIFLK